MRLIILTLLFLYVFSIQFLAIPISAPRLIILALAPLILHYIHSKKFNFHPTTLYAVFALCLLCLYYTGLSVFYEHKEISLTISLTLSIIEVVLGSFLIVDFIRRVNGDISTEKMMKLIVIITTLQALFIILTFIFPPFRIAVFSIIKGPEQLHKITSVTSIIKRVSGISAVAGAGLSMMQFFGFACSYTLAHARHTPNRIFYIIACLLIFVSNIVVGRSGLILAVAFSIGYSGLFFLLNKRKDVAVKNITKLISLCIIGLLALYFSLSESLRHYISYKVLPWALEIVLAGGDPAESKTVSTISRFLFLPDTWQGILFGYGTFDSLNGVHRNSDSGFVRLIFSFGVLGCTLFYSIFLKLSHTLIKIEKNHTFSIFMIIVMSFFLVFESKEPFLTFLPIQKLFFLLFFSAILSKKVAS
jgi:hypothetical protein